MTAQWHVRVFEVRETKRGMLGGKKRVSKGFSWSASGEPEGYLYGAQTFESVDAAEENARKQVSEQGGDVISVSAPGSRSA